MTTQTKLATSYWKAEGMLRIAIPYTSFRCLVGYESAVQVLAYLIREEASKNNYEDMKTEALNCALKVVKGYKYLKKDHEQLIIDVEDVELSIKQLIRASRIDLSVDEFILKMIS